MVKALLYHVEAYDRRIFWSLLLALFGVLALYMLFLGTSVYAVIERKDAEHDAERLLAEISILESSYVLLEREISLLRAHELGFVDITVPRYVSRADEGDTFTLRTPAP